MPACLHSHAVNILQIFLLPADYALRIVTPMTGNELRQVRERLGLTQVELAARVGLDSNSVARQERGEVMIREPLAKLYHRLLAEQTNLHSEPKRRR